MKRIISVSSIAAVAVAVILSIFGVATAETSGIFIEPQSISFGRVPITATVDLKGEF